MNFWFKKNNKRWNTPSIKAIEDIVLRLKSEVNREDLIKHITEPYKKFLFESEKEQMFCLMNLYTNIEDFIEKNKIPVLKRKIDIKAIRSELLKRQSSNKIPSYFEAILHEEPKRSLILILNIANEFLNFCRKSIGEEKAENIFSDWLKKHNMNLPRYTIKNIFISEKAFTSGLYSDTEIEFVFRDLFELFFNSLKEKIGDTYSINEITNISLPVLKAIDRPTSIKLLRMLPSNIFEKEFASFLTREELERQVMEKTKNLEKEKESVDAKIRERTFEYRTERDKLKLIAENMSEGVLLLDPYRSVLFKNTKLNNIFAIPEDSTEEIVLAGFDRLISSADARILMDESLKKGTYSTTIENSGRVYSVSCIYISDKDKGNNISGFLWWIRDITEEKSLERKKSEFISIAAHQLRTPLSGIKWTLNMMVNEELGPLSDDQKVFLLKLQESNDRMIHLVNDLLQADRLETDKTEYTFEKVDFGSMAKNISEDLKITAKNNGLNLYVSVKQNNDLSVYGDKEKLHSVIQNLVDNAIKYTLKGGSINVSCETNKERRVMLSVSDTGIGIIKSQQEKIFGRFFRGSNALKIKTDGTGLGLYIVKQIVERHGGSVSFESTEGIGSRFVVTLPHFDDKSNKKNK